MRPPLRVIRALCVAAVVLFIALFGAARAGVPEWLGFTNGVVAGLAVGAAMLLFRSPPRMGWGWHIALIIAVSAAASFALVADHGWVAVMVEADGGDAASPLERAAMPLYATAVVCAGAVVGILTAQRVARPRRFAVAVLVPAVLLALALAPATRSGVEAVGLFAGTLGGLAFLIAPLVAVVVLVMTLHTPTIERMQQRWSDELRAEAEAAERAAKAQSDS